MTQRFQELAFTPKVLETQLANFGRQYAVEGGAADDVLSPMESSFIAQRDSFYMASVNEGGWPYMQHRGGDAGFLRVHDESTLVFADLSGNRQMLSTGNVAQDDRVALFFMDYARRQRLKIMGHAQVIAASEEKLEHYFGEDGRPEAERIWVIRVVAYDWNCPKYITPRFTAEEVDAHTEELRRRVVELEERLKDLSDDGASL